MAPRALRPVIDGTRRLLRAGAVRRTGVRRVMEVTARELARALDDDVYGAGYFGAGRNPLTRMGLSGYERYDRATSNADVAAYVLWKFFDGRRALDVGCAMGFVVEALRELGVDAQGVDVSQYAVEHAALGARGHVRYGNLLQRLPFRDGHFDVVSALETLEHLPPDAVPAALRELRRVTGGWLVATIPSFGPNVHGPGGWFDVKVRPERLDHYRSLGPAYEGPVPYDDLYRDAEGQPIEGHLTIASFAWWTRRFADAGFERCGEVERRIHPDLARFGLTKYWNLYVLRVPGTPVPAGAVRDAVAVAGVERRWHLDSRVADPADVAAVRDAIG